MITGIEVSFIVHYLAGNPMVAMIAIVVLGFYLALSEILPYLTKQKFPWMPLWVDKANNVIQLHKNFALALWGKLTGTPWMGGSNNGSTGTSSNSGTGSGVMGAGS